MTNLASVLRDGFEAAFDDVVVEEMTWDVFGVRYSFAGRHCHTVARPIAPGQFPPDETTFLFQTWIHDPLEAFGRRMDWRMVDGFDSNARPYEQVRKGTPSEVVDDVAEVVSRYVQGRWPSTNEQESALAP